MINSNNLSSQKNEAIVGQTADFDFGSLTPFVDHQLIMLSHDTQQLQLTNYEIKENINRLIDSI